MSTGNLSLHKCVECYYCKMAEVFSEPDFQLFNFSARYEIFKATEASYLDNLDC